MKLSNFISLDTGAYISKDLLVKFLIQSALV